MGDPGADCEACLLCLLCPLSLLSLILLHWRRLCMRQWQGTAGLLLHAAGFSVPLCLWPGCLGHACLLAFPCSADAPPITLVIVQKRHHTRFFPMPQDQQNRDRSGNIMPGGRGF